MNHLQLNFIESARSRGPASLVGQTAPPRLYTVRVLLWEMCLVSSFLSPPFPLSTLVFLKLFAE
jgi:hypothetical protein